MSIFSRFKSDNSDLLARRFAELATKYFDDPSSAQGATAEIALENLFRILEVFRYRAYSDENRKGILAMGKASLTRPSLTNVHPWHTKIENALAQSLNEVYHDEEESFAIMRLQNALRDVTEVKEPKGGMFAREKSFFKSFEAALQ